MKMQCKLISINTRWEEYGYPYQEISTWLGKMKQYISTVILRDVSWTFSPYFPINQLNLVEHLDYNIVSNFHKIKIVKLGGHLFICFFLIVLCQRSFFSREKKS